ncbi:putative capsular polysaccharide synthesis family protein [Desulfobacterota bacterium M19]
MMPGKQPIYNGNESTEQLLQQIADSLHFPDNIRPSLLTWLIFQATQLNATDIHIDMINGCCSLSLRIEGEMKYICNIPLKTGLNIVNNIKRELRIDSIELQEPWSGWFSTPKNYDQQYEVHIIPFKPLESVIVRLKPLTPAKPSWTNTPGIKKKIFIWQMGKVGSSTILASIKPYTSRYNWYHDYHDTAIKSDEPYWQYNNLIHSHSAKPIYHTLHHSDEEFIVISLVRDLLQRNISAVFQSMADKIPGNDCFIAPQRELENWDYKRICREIKKKLLYLNLSDQLISWYDRLFKSHFYYPDVDRYHIDLYGVPFDRQRGFQVYDSKTTRIKFIIIRLENLNDLEAELGFFLGIRKFRLINNNIAEHKWYNKIYKQFKIMYKPTREELNHIYNSKFMKYFYTSEQIDRFISRWL